MQFSSESIRFATKSKVGKMKCIVTVKDSYRPLIKDFVLYQHSSVQPVHMKMNRNAKLRATLGDIYIHQQRSPLAITNKSRSIIIKRYQTNGLMDSIQFRKHPVYNKIKSGKHEMHSNC